jgi:DNA-binding XRE family transcriptional regulator
MNLQTIKKSGKPEWAVIPYKLYLRLVEDAEFKEDMMLLEKALAKKDQEFIPADVVDRIIDGENLIKVWREYRGLTQQQLANQAGISKAHLSQLESDNRKCTAVTLASIAKVLNLTIDDLVREDL